MIEVESKCTVMHPQILLHRLYQQTTYVGEVYNRDEYYALKQDIHEGRLLSDVAENSIVRLRYRSYDLKNRHRQYYLTRKKKKLKQGIEVNDETEIKISNAQQCRTMLSLLGYVCFIQKTKHSQCFRLSDLSLEFNWMGVLGFFLEIEKLCESESEVNQALDNVKQTFYQFGFIATDFVKDRYIDLLWNHLHQKL